MKFPKKIGLLLIFLIGLFLRLYGLNWDQGQHLHPDERFLTMVASDIKMPSSVFEYFNTASSPLNPYNYPSYQFFVYGTFPLFLTKLIATILRLDNYQNIVLVGRALSAIFDSINIFILYFLAKIIFSKKTKYIFLPSLFYALCVLPIQLSHFFAVDTFLSFFVLLTFYFLICKRFLFAGISFGLALTCKISALYILPIIGLFMLSNIIKSKNIFVTTRLSVIFALLSFISFRIFQPYSFVGFFKINPLFISNIKDLQVMSAPGGNFPPSIQWVSKIPLFDSLLNLSIFGLGLPIIFLLVLGIFKSKPNKYPIIIYLSIFWILILFLYQGSRFAHPMRYLVVIYPFICLVVGYFGHNLNQLIVKIILSFHFVYCLFFVGIYSRPHSRLQASNWIYQNIPFGSKISNEYWDDSLPLNTDFYSSNVYDSIMLSPYDFDTPEKIEKLQNQISGVDYIIMSSNRLWGSIPLVPQIYPFTSQYYKDVFNNKLNFQMTAKFNSYPGSSLPFLHKCYYFGPSNYPGIKNYWFDIDDTCTYPGIYLRDDIAEESFTVYDHPKVLIFSRHNN